MPSTDAGRPIPSPTTSTTSSHDGAGHGSASTTVHVAAVTPTTPSTTRDRSHGRHVLSAPATGPNTIVHTTNSVTSAPAAPLESPWAETSHGTPHSNVNTFIENCTDWCEKKPTRVPGRPHTVRRRRPISATDTAGPRSGGPPGASRTSTRPSTATSPLAPAAVPNAV